MDHQQFASAFVSVRLSLVEMIQAVTDDPSLIGALSIEDYTLFASLVKEYEWLRGGV